MADGSQDAWVQVESTKEKPKLKGWGDDDDEPFTDLSSLTGDGDDLLKTPAGGAVPLSPLSAIPIDQESPAKVDDELAPPAGAAGENDPSTPSTVKPTAQPAPPAEPVDTAQGTFIY